MEEILIEQRISRYPLILRLNRTRDQVINNTFSKRLKIKIKSQLVEVLGRKLEKYVSMYEEVCMICMVGMDGRRRYGRYGWYCSIVLCYCIVLYGSVRYGMVWYGMVIMV